MRVTRWHMLMSASRGLDAQARAYDRGMAHACAACSATEVGAGAQKHHRAVVPRHDSSMACQAMQHEGFTKKLGRDIHMLQVRHAPALAAQVRGR